MRHFQHTIVVRITKNGQTTTETIPSSVRKGRAERHLAETRKKYAGQKNVHIEIGPKIPRTTVSSSST